MAIARAAASAKDNIGEKGQDKVAMIKKYTIYVVTIKGQKVPYHITPSQDKAHLIAETFPDKEFEIKKLSLTDGMLVNLLIENPWSFNKEEFSEMRIV